MALVLVVLMSMATLLVVSSVRPAADDAYTAVLRVETARAFYAAESGLQILLRRASAGEALPEEGESLDLGSAAVRFVAVPTDTGEVVIEGSSGAARRRIRIEME